MRGAGSSLPSPIETSGGDGNLGDSNPSSDVGTGESMASGPQTMKSSFSSAQGTPETAGGASSPSGSSFPVADNSNFQSVSPVDRSPAAGAISEDDRDARSNGKNVGPAPSVKVPTAPASTTASAHEDSPRQADRDNVLALQAPLSARRGRKPSAAATTEESADKTNGVGGEDKVSVGAMAAPLSAGWLNELPASRPLAGSGRGGAVRGRGPAGRGAGRGGRGTGSGAGRGDGATSLDSDPAALFKCLSVELGEMLASRGGAIPIERAASDYNRFFNRRIYLGGYKLRALVEERQLEGIFMQYGETPRDNKIMLNWKLIKQLKESRVLGPDRAVKNNEGQSLGDNKGHGRQMLLTKLTRTVVNKNALEGSPERINRRSRSPIFGRYADVEGDKRGWNENDRLERSTSASYPAEKTVFNITNSLAGGQNHVQTDTERGRSRDSRNHSPEARGKTPRTDEFKSRTPHRRNSSLGRLRSRSRGRGRSRSVSGGRRGVGSFDPITRKDHAPCAEHIPDKERYSSRKQSNRISTRDDRMRDSSPERRSRDKEQASRRADDRRRDERRSSRERASTRLRGRDDRLANDRRGSERENRLRSPSLSPDRRRPRPASNLRSSTRDVQDDLDRISRSSRYRDLEDERPYRDSGGHQHSSNNAGNGEGRREPSPVERRAREGRSPKRTNHVDCDGMTRSERHARGLPNRGLLPGTAGRGDDTNAGDVRPDYVSLAAKPAHLSSASKREAEERTSRAGYESLHADDALTDRRRISSEKSDARNGYGIPSRAPSGVGGRTDGRASRSDGHKNDKGRGDVLPTGYGTLSRQQLDRNSRDDAKDSRIRSSGGINSLRRVDGGDGDARSGSSVTGAVGRDRSNSFKGSANNLSRQGPREAAVGPQTSARPSNKRRLMGAEGAGNVEVRARCGSFDQEPLMPRPGASPPRKRHAGIDGVAGIVGGNRIPEVRMHSHGTGSSSGRDAGAPGGWADDNDARPVPPRGPAGLDPSRHPGMLVAPRSTMPPAVPGRMNGARLMIKGTHPAVPERRVHALVSEFGVVGKIEVLEGFVLVHMRSHEEASRAVAGIDSKLAPHVSAGDEPLSAAVWDEQTYQILMLRDNLRQYADSMRKASSWYEKHKNDALPGPDGPLPCRFYALGRGCIFGRNCIFAHVAVPRGVPVDDGPRRPAHAGPRDADKAFVSPRSGGGPMEPPGRILDEGDLLQQPPKRYDNGQPPRVVAHGHFQQGPQDLRRDVPPRPHPHKFDIEGGGGDSRVSRGPWGGSVGRRKFPGQSDQNEQRREKHGMIRDEEMLMPAGARGAGRGDSREGGGEVNERQWHPEGPGRRGPPRPDTIDDRNGTGEYLGRKGPPPQANIERSRREPPFVMDSGRDWHAGQSPAHGRDVSREDRFREPRRPLRDPEFGGGGGGSGGGANFQRRGRSASDDSNRGRHGPQRRTRTRSRSNDGGASNYVPLRPNGGLGRDREVARNKSFDHHDHGDKLRSSTAQQCIAGSGGPPSLRRSDSLVFGSEEEFGYSRSNGGRGDDRKRQRNSPVSARQGYATERGSRAGDKVDRRGGRGRDANEERDSPARRRQKHSRSVDQRNGSRHRGGRGRRRDDHEDDNSNRDKRGSSRQNSRRDSVDRRKYGNLGENNRGRSSLSEDTKRSSRSSGDVSGKKRSATDTRRGGARNTNGNSERDGERKARNKRTERGNDGRAHTGGRKTRHGRESSSAKDNSGHDGADTTSQKSRSKSRSSKRRKKLKASPSAGAFPEPPPSKTTFTVVASRADVAQARERQQRELAALPTPPTPPPIEVPPTKTKFCIRLGGGALSTSPRYNGEGNEAVRSVEGQWDAGGRGNVRRGGRGQGSAGRGRGGRGPGGRGRSGRGEGPAGRGAGGRGRGRERGREPYDQGNRPFEPMW